MINTGGPTYRLKAPMAGIFYDPHARRLHAVDQSPDAGWMLVTHNLDAGLHHCRRIMREWLPADDLLRVDWNITDHRRTA